jgi:hypothetical protein
MSRQQELAAKYLALEVPIAQAAKLVGCSRQTIHTWLGTEDFRSLVAKFTEDHLALLEDILLEGERGAAIALTELLHSDSEEMRFKAATRLLDMRGVRGKPVDKSEVRELKGDLNELLKLAMRDPSVRKLLAVPPLLSVRSLEPLVSEVTPGVVALGEQNYEILDDQS